MRNLKELLQLVSVQNVFGDLNKEVSTICYDSRKVEKNSIFVAMQGLQTDGHRYIQDAIINGAKVIIGEIMPSYIKIPEDVTFIVVQNSRKALAGLSNVFYGSPSKSLKIVGVTGTNGKTTTAFLIKQILEEGGIPTGLIGTTGVYYGNESIPATHTTPEPLELERHLANMRDQNIQAVSMEVSSHALVQHRVDYIEFSGGIFTNLTHEHLDYHKSMEEYARAKKMLFDKLGRDAIAVVNSESNYASYMLQDCKAEKKFYVGQAENSDVRIINERLLNNGSAFSLLFKEKFNGLQQVDIETPLLGRFNITNSALSAVLALFLGVDVECILGALSKVKGAPGRMQSISLRNGAVALVDYAHTPDALEKALEACREVLIAQNSNSKLICVFGCGGNRDNAKRPIMGNIASQLADYVILTDDNPREEDPDKILLEIYKGVPNDKKHKVVMISHRAEAINYAVSFARAGDIILAAGKGHENYQIYGKEKLYFSDVDELNKYV